MVALRMRHRRHISPSAKFVKCLSPLPLEEIASSKHAVFNGQHIYIYISKTSHTETDKRKTSSLRILLLVDSTCLTPSVLAWIEIPGVGGRGAGGGGRGDGTIPHSTLSPPETLLLH